jgi:hypothetical protein
MKLISEFWKEEDAVGVVEVILILVENQGGASLVCFV